MEQIYILITLLVTFIISLIIGAIAYKIDMKKNYSLIGNFPFEMQSMNNGIITLIFRIVLGVSIVVMSYASLYVLVFEEHSIFISKALAGLMIFTNLILMSQFIISFKSFKNHLVSSSIFLVSALMSYLLFGYYTVRDDFKLYPFAITIVSFIIALIILIIMFIPSLSNWYKKKKSVDEKGNEVFVRSKFNILAFFEWLTIILYILLFVLIIIGRLI